jgi:hypothetical protein
MGGGVCCTVTALIPPANNDGRGRASIDGIIIG